MKAKEVLRLLRVTRQTLSKYVKEGIINVEVKDNGQYDYNPEDVFNLISGKFDRKFYLYLKEMNSYPNIDFDQIYIDNINSRDKYYKLINDILNFKVQKLMVDDNQYCEDELKLLKHVCKKCGANLVYIE